MPLPPMATKLSDATRSAIPVRKHHPPNRAALQAVNLDIA